MLQAAFEHVAKLMAAKARKAATTGINYKGTEAMEGAFLINTLIGNLGPISGESHALRTMAGKWQATCAENDADESGTINVEEAKAVWATVCDNLGAFCREKLFDLRGSEKKIFDLRGFEKKI